MEEAPVLPHCSFLRSPLPKPTGVLDLVVKEKPTADSARFGAFASDRIPNATNDINYYFVIHSSNSSGF